MGALSTYLLGFFFIYSEGECFVLGKLTFTASSVSVAENSSLVLTCSYNETLQLITMSLNENVKGTLLPDCDVFTLQPDPTMYTYKCPTNRHLLWTIKTVTRTNEGNTWECKVDYAGGFESATYTISVYVPAQSVTLLSPPENIVTVQENKEVVFVCTTSGGLPGATVRWYKMQGTAPVAGDVAIVNYVTVTTRKTSDDLVSVTSTLRISPAKGDNGIAIYCTANNSTNRVISARKPLLNVQYSPGSPTIPGFSLDAPAVGPLSNQNIIAGSPLNLSCPVINGNPPVTTFKWTRNDSMSWNQQILYIRNVTKNDDMLYTCTVQNTMNPTGALQQNGKDSGSFHLNVLDTTQASSFFIKGYKKISVVVANENEDVRFTCEIYSNPASIVTIIFGNHILKEERNTRSLSFSKKSLSCIDSGLYTCKYRNPYGQYISKSITLHVNCSPRPLYRIKHNVTSSLSDNVTISFTVLAYPEPGPTGFVWHKEVGSRWMPLLSNVDLLIQSSGVQSNATILNVSKSDYGQYRITVTNDIGRYDHYLFLEEKSSQTDLKNIAASKEDTKNEVMIVGATLGIVIACVTAYAISITIYYKRKVFNAGGQSIDKRSTEQRTYANMFYNKSEVEDEEEEKDEPSSINISVNGNEDATNQYTDLCQYPELDRMTYDVLQPHIK